MKNVLHLCESSETGGAESIVIAIAENLDKSRFNSSVCLLSEGWLKTQLDERQIETTVIPQPHSFDFAWLFRLRRLLKERCIHLMHAHEFATNVYATVVARMTGIPVVTTAHGKNYYADRLRRRMAYRFVARQSRMVAVSQDLKQFLMQRVAIPAGNIQVIHNGIDLGRYVNIDCKQAVRQELGIDANSPVLGTVGNLFPVKGQVYLLRACAIVARDYPDVVLLIAGEGGEAPSLEAEARALGIQGNVRFLGFRDDVPSLLQAMDVFVLPSLSEGLPLSVLEAMALARPIVASNVGGIPEVVKDGMTGYLVRPKDPEALAERILLVLRRPEAAAELGRLGRNRIQESFTLEHMIHQYQSLYEAALTNRCGTSGSNSGKKWV